MKPHHSLTRYLQWTPAGEVRVSFLLGHGPWKVALSSVDGPACMHLLAPLTCDSGLKRTVNFLFPIIQDSLACLELKTLYHFHHLVIITSSILVLEF